MSRPGFSTKMRPQRVFPFGVYIHHSLDRRTLVPRTCLLGRGSLYNTNRLLMQDARNIMKVLEVLWIDIYLLLVLKANGDVVSAEICTKSVCEYEFVVRESRTMMFTTNDSSSYPVKILSNGTLRLATTTYHRQAPDVFVSPDDVHTADGHTRTIITINGKFPGPAIEVMEGAQVVLNVVNELQESSLAIHFHGMHMKDNPWMDGTAYVSQCPVRPKESFQYRFIASPAGTHWYHSHFQGQRADGLFGPLIVHRSKPSIPYMTLMINDWYSLRATEVFLRSPYLLPRGGIGDIYEHAITRHFIFDGTETSVLRYWSGLINGRGRHGNNSSPLSVFKVKAGQKYRFHLIFSSMEYNYRFSIDQHQLTVIESDGYPVKPVQVQSLLGFIGERFVVEFTANQNVTKYWIRAEAIITGQSRDPQPDGENRETLAILQYEGAVEGEPKSSHRNCTEENPCVVLNCPWKMYHKEWYPNRKCIPISDLRLDTNIYKAKEDMDTKQDEIVEIFFNFDFPYGSSVNYHRNVMPRAPLFQDSSTWGKLPCPSNCIDKGCLCTNVVSIPPNRTIQLVLTANSMANTDMHHPIHIHGHSFQVLKLGFPIAHNETGRIQKRNPDLICETKACSKQRWADGQPTGLNFDYPPIKDTVSVPASGYVVIRFKSDNPGYWFLHCHQLTHHLEGMSLILNESHANLPPPPANFPTCQQFNMTSREFELMLEKNKRCTSGNCIGSTSKASSLVNMYGAWTCLLLVVSFIFLV